MFSYTIDGQNCTITGIANPNTTKIVIPEFIQNCQILCIDAAAFKNNMVVEEVHMPDALYYIFDEAFYGCANLRVVHFYKSAKPSNSICFHRAVFQNCIRLRDILFDNPTVLDFMLNTTRCFQDCHSLKNIEGYFSWSIPGHTFHNCYELDNLVFKQAIFNGITFAGTSLIGCRCLKNVTLLGNLSPCTPTSVLKKLSKMNVKCPQNSNVASLMTPGANIQFLQNVSLPTDKIPDWVKARIPIPVF